MPVQRGQGRRAQGGGDGLDTLCVCAYGYSSEVIDHHPTNVRHGPLPLSPWPSELTGSGRQRQEGGGADRHIGSINSGQASICSPALGSETVEPDRVFYAVSGKLGSQIIEW